MGIVFFYLNIYIPLQTRNDIAINQNSAIEAYT